MIARMIALGTSASFSMFCIVSGTLLEKYKTLKTTHLEKRRSTCCGVSARGKKRISASVTPSAPIVRYWRVPTPSAGVHGSFYFGALLWSQLPIFCKKLAV